MKRFFKVIAIFMVVILCLGSISLLFDGGSSDKPSGPGTIVQRPPADTDVPEDPEVPEACSHVDADDNSLCDKCSESYTDGQDVFGGTVTQLIDFKYGADSDFIFAGNKYGTKTYEDGYLKLYTTEEDEGLEIDNFIRLYLCDDRSSISLNLVDYITVDFDIWTDDEFILPLTVIFGNSAEKYFSGNAPRIYESSEGGAYFTILGQEGAVVLKRFNGTEPIHVTLIVKPYKSGGNYYPQICMYLDGEKAITTVLAATDDLGSIRFGMGKQTVSANKSVCMDNIQVSTFGDGSGSYDGAIATAFSENGYSLTECIDSVLYNKNN